MKFEVEITQDDIRPIIARSVRLAIAEYSNGLPLAQRQQIKQAVRQAFEQELTRVIEEEVQKESLIREQVLKEIKARIVSKVRASL